MKRVRLIISGDVQGVSLRAWARAQAQDLGLTGWVKNREDGAVEVVAEGTKLKEFVLRCQRGPEVACSPLLRSGAGRRAWVEKVDVEWGIAKGEFVNFQVVY